MNLSVGAKWRICSPLCSASSPLQAGGVCHFAFLPLVDHCHRVPPRKALLFARTHQSKCSPLPNVTCCFFVIWSPLRPNLVLLEPAQGEEHFGTSLANLNSIVLQLVIIHMRASQLFSGQLAANLEIFSPPPTLFSVLVILRYNMLMFGEGDEGWVRERYMTPRMLYEARPGRGLWCSEFETTH